MDTNGSRGAASVPAQPAGTLWAGCELPLKAAIGLGAVGCLTSLLVNSQQFFFSYLAAFTFATTLVLGMMFFVLVHHLTDSGWSVVVRRPAEQFLAAIPWLAVLFIPIAVGLAAGKLHPWVTVEKRAKAEQEKLEKGERRISFVNNNALNPKDPLSAGDVILGSDQIAKLKAGGEAVLNDEQLREKKLELEEDIHKIHMKGAYLNVPFFLVRCALYFGIWYFLARILRGKSLEQDKTGNPALSLQMRSWSAPGMYLYALSLTFFAFDLLMSLDFKWFSTMFGVYVFAGGVVASYALLAAITTLLLPGPFKGLVPPDRYHDIGKFMFAFSIFWAYIAFGQFFLIWYANIPEETIWYQHRWTDQWQIVTTIMPTLRFAVPFIVLLSVAAKKNPKVMLPIGIVMVAVHYLDHYWMVMPTYNHGAVFNAGLLTDIAAVLLVAGSVALVVLKAMAADHLYPIRDPRLAEATADSHGHSPHAVGHGVAAAH